ncbi:MAG: hypothetical protein K4571_00680 [Deltaproteobacteria bacterium]
MRSEQERDQCIDVLMAEVRSLEEEVAKLKGTPPAEESVSAEQTPEDDSSRGIFIPGPEQKKETGRSEQGRQGIRSAFDLFSFRSPFLSFVNLIIGLENASATGDPSEIFSSAKRSALSSGTDQE